VAHLADAAGVPPCALIETVAGRVADACLADDRIGNVEVTVHKPGAPLPVITGDVAVTLHRAAAQGAAGRA
jgi:7,8-dihydroneopterin aldolase/epimerase/oxygenase